MENPLLTVARTGGLPDFSRIAPAHAEPAIDTLLAEARAALAPLLQPGATRTWDSLVVPLETLSDRLALAWAAIGHLWGVRNTPEWRAAYNACLPKVTAWGLELAQSEPLFQAYQALAAAPGFSGEAPARRKAVSDALRDFRLAGIGLPADRKERYRQIALRLSELQAQFAEALVDATQAWSLHVTDVAQLRGMTADGLAQAAERARARGLDGWLLTLDFPSYDSVITHADDRALRARIYEAYVTRASDLGPQAGQFDNGARMAEILALRQEQAQLLGHANYAELSLATKMAESPDAVEGFLLDLAARARPRARAELQQLEHFAGHCGTQPDSFAGPLEAWDIPYYAEKLKQQALGLSDEVLRPYFPAPQAIAGMLEVAARLYGVRFAQRADVSTWHPDVTYYELLDDAGQAFAGFYLDPYAREAKRGGAWMDVCRGRRRTPSGLQQPVAFLTCNFTPPLPGQPALLSHDEVRTLFHEFGHGLQHLLTRVDVAAVAGINGVEWDAVELPSQFMENWCFPRETLLGFARHWQTGAPLPDELLGKLQAARTFHAALATVRQLEFALFDLRLHRQPAPAPGAEAVAAIYRTLAAVREQVSVIRPPAFNRFPHGFTHVFAGGYAAGYYSYKWAEVLSADAFAAFEEEGLLNPAVGARFRDTVLAQGGSRPAMDVFVEFRGRKPRIEPLLRQTGLAAQP